MCNRVNFWVFMFSAFLAYTGLTLGIPLANAQPSERPCSEFLQPFIDWAKPGNPRGVNTSVAFNNVDKGLVTYSSGTLQFQNGNITGNLTKLLSNRLIQLPGGGPFGGPSQPFSIKEPATVVITIAADGVVTWVEQSFNNATFTYKAVCYSNDTAILLDDINKATGVITLVKVQGPP